MIRKFGPISQFGDFRSREVRLYLIIISALSFSRPYCGNIVFAESPLEQLIIETKTADPQLCKQVR